MITILSKNGPSGFIFISTQVKMFNSSEQKWCQYQISNEYKAEEKSYQNFELIMYFLIIDEWKSEWGWQFVEVKRKSIRVYLAIGLG